MSVEHPNGATITVQGRASMLTTTTAANGQTIVVPRSDAAVEVEDAGDPHRWLEGVLDERALAWVRETNAKTVATVGEPTEAAVYSKLLGILESRDKIPHINKRGKYYYNFWQDAEHVKGIYRRTSLEEYRKPEPLWELVLDIDALGKAESTSWVWKGTALLDEVSLLPYLSVRYPHCHAWRS